MNPRSSSIPFFVSTTLLALLAGSASARTSDQPSVAPEPTMLGRLHHHQPIWQAKPGPQNIAQQPSSRFFWTPRSFTRDQIIEGTPETRALAYLSHFATSIGLTPNSLQGAKVHATHLLRGGATIVQFSQHLDGIEVYGARISVLMDAHGGLHACSGQLFPVAGHPLRSAFKWSDRQALANAIAAHTGKSSDPSQLEETANSDSNYQFYHLRTNSGSTADLSLQGPARTKKVYFDSKGRFVPAYFTEFIAQRRGEPDNEGRATIVSAIDGAILLSWSLTDNDAFKYRVWAEQDGNHTPLDGPTLDYSPHPSGTPDQSAPARTDPILIEMEGFNTNPNGVADPWLTSSDTETKGNNVDAYSDRNHITDPNTGAAINNGFDNEDYRARITAPFTFDRFYDFDADPAADEDQIMAAVTQLFYVTNWMHDYWYDSGFDEKSGIAQRLNYGRGGVQNDALLAEAQDQALGGLRNNARMNTPADGLPPRMQMYLWRNRDVERGLTVTPTPEGFDGATGISYFGPTDFDLTAKAVLVQDGTDSTTDGCQEPTNDLSGKIAVVEAGFPPGGTTPCFAAVRASIAQAAGAVGLIYIGQDTFVPALSDNKTLNLTIPGLGIAKPDGDLLVAQLNANEEVELRMKRVTRVEIDGSIDNQLVAHEWGHYIHRRLVPCTGTNGCNGQSEGWGDYMALHMTVRAQDPEDGAYPICGSSTVSYTPDNYYFGIRRYPFSTDMTKNPLTFKHIKRSEPLPQGVPRRRISTVDNAEEHNSGEVWASALLDAHAMLVGLSREPNATVTWEQAHRRMANYIVAGMKMAPTNPTYVEQRDAILAVAAATDMKDFDALAAGFAKRGLGTCAVAPPAESEDNEEAIEGFDLKGRISFQNWQLDDDEISCDDDGVLDSDEQGHLTIKIANRGAAPLTATMGKVSTSSNALVFANNGEVMVPELPPFSESTIKIAATIKSTLDTKALAPIKIELSNPDACEVEVIKELNVVINADDVLNTSKMDDFEASQVAWTTTQNKDISEILWTRIESVTDDQANHLFWGKDFSLISDTSLITPGLVVGTEPLIIDLEHAFSFEATQEDSNGPYTFWDGGLIEVSSDDGLTWVDVSTYTDPGYGGTIGNIENSVNPLAGRPGFVGKSDDDFPALKPLRLDFGTMLANRTIKLRFRIGTDAFTGDSGWLIDNVAVTGITNNPFPTLSADACDDDTESTSGDDDDDTGEDTGSTSGEDTGTDTGTDSDTDTGSTSAEDTGEDTGTTTSGTGTTTSTGGDTGGESTAGTAGGEEGEETGGETGGPDPDSDSSDGGCNCSTTATAHTPWKDGLWLALLIGPLGFARRRRLNRR